MKKLLVVAIVLGLGYAAYAYVIRPPEKRACARISELCGGERQVSSADLEQCRSMFSSLGKDNPEQARKVGDCLSGATSCGEAIGCSAGAALNVGAGFAKSFFEGLQKSLK